MSDERNRLIREGFIAGLLGYGAVVALFAVLNVAAGLSPFHTASVLGTALLGSALDQAGPLGPVLAYNGLHLVVSILLGVGASFLANQAEADHDLGSGVVFGLLAIGYGVNAAQCPDQLGNLAVMRYHLLFILRRFGSYQVQQPFD